MQLLFTPKEINQKLCEYTKKYKNISFSIAWASKNNDVSKLLLNDFTKLIHCTIGLHFHQTHPDFIEPFIVEGPIKFIKKSEGVFHPKIYLFWDDRTHWVCLIGSANLTKSALYNNDKTMMIIDTKEEKLFDSIKTQIETYHIQAAYISYETFLKYKKCWELKNKNKNNKDDFEEVTALGISNLFQLSWDEYFVRLKKTKKFQERLNLLTKANELFRTNRFDALSEMTRKNLAGVVKKGESIPNWHLFGRMPVPYFSNRLSNKDSHKGYKFISEQLEHILINKTINKKDYKLYLTYFIEHDGWGYSISTISRLLAMKRPDQFFCLTKANEPALLEALNIDNSIQHDYKENMYDRYWDEIIQSVRQTPWYNSKEPKTSVEENLAWKYRTALMDALLYLEH